MRSDMRDATTISLDTWIMDVARRCLGSVPLSSDSCPTPPFQGVPFTLSGIYNLLNTEQARQNSAVIITTITLQKKDPERQSARERLAHSDCGPHTATTTIIMATLQNLLPFPFSATHIRQPLGSRPHIRWYRHTVADSNSTPRLRLFT